jgi:hypothetical protein
MLCWIPPLATKLHRGWDFLLTLLKSVSQVSCTDFLARTRERLYCLKVPVL